MIEFTDKLSERALNFPDNPIRGLEALAIEAKNKGIRIIPLNIGAPDTPSPKEVSKSINEYLISNDHIEYGPSAGDNKLRQARSRFYKENLDLDIEPENILITAGASEAMDLAIFSVTNPGDEILTPEPFFPNYLATCYKYGSRLGTIPTRIEDGYHIIYDSESPNSALNRIDSLVNPKTKAILWSSPSNPTGAIYKEEELDILFQVAKKHNLFLVSDEVYRLLAYDGGITSKKGLLRAPSIYDVIPKTERWRVLCLDSSSKEISFCGGRIGYLILDQDLAPIVLKNASVRACPSILGQRAVEEIDQVDSEYFLKNQQELKSRRDLTYTQLSAMRDIGVKVSPQPPEGAFYISLDLGDGVPADAFCRWMLTDFPQLSNMKTTVFLTPMRSGKGGFYLGENKGFSEVRIAYVRDSHELTEAMSILRLAIKKYKNIE